jgi:hypothetical protein
LLDVFIMPAPLDYFSTNEDWYQVHQAGLSWEQEAMNAGARRLLSARARDAFPRLARPQPARHSLPAVFAPRPRISPASSAWDA